MAKDTPTIIALIPARSGSQRVPHKNIRPLGGDPLMAYSIAAAVNSGVFSEVLVSTDSDKYADIARHYGASVPFLRPNEYAESFSPDIEFVEHALNSLRDQGREYDCFSILRPTSPFRKAETIQRAWSEFLAQEGYRRGLQNSDYVKKEVQHWQEELVFNRMRKMLLDTVTVSESEMNDFYAKNRSKYVEPVRVNIREIFVNDEGLANDLLKRIKTGENFGELAKKNSLRKWAASKGGEFGFFGAGMHGKVGKLALAKNAGDLAGPYEIDDPTYGPGFSIFKVFEKKEERYRTLQEVKKQVEEDALAAKQNKVLTNFLDDLKKEYKIEIKEKLLDRIQTTDEFAKGRRVEMFVAPRF